MSTNRRIHPSNRLEENPATAPINVPATAEIPKALAATISEVRLPQTMRLKMSLPN